MIKMEIGRLSSPDAVFKRKFRWVFFLGEGEIEGTVVTAGTVTTEGHICKISSRPVINFDEQQVQHLIEVINLPAKAQWDSISITCYDMEGESYLYEWLISFYNPNTGQVNPIANIENRRKPKKTGFIKLLNGHGTPIESWELQGCWPASIDWGDLDYESSDLATVSFQLRYDRAILKDSNTGNAI